jgi:hypothetical protein
MNPQYLEIVQQMQQQMQQNLLQVIERMMPST